MDTIRKNKWTFCTINIIVLILFFSTTLFSKDLFQIESETDLEKSFQNEKINFGYDDQGKLLICTKDDSKDCFPVPLYYLINQDEWQHLDHALHLLEYALNHGYGETLKDASSFLLSVGAMAGVHSKYLAPIQRWWLRLPSYAINIFLTPLIVSMTTDTSWELISNLIFDTQGKIKKITETYQLIRQTNNSSIFFKESFVHQFSEILSNPFINTYFVERFKVNGFGPALIEFKKQVAPLLTFKDQVIQNYSASVFFKQQLLLQEGFSFEDKTQNKKALWNDPRFLTGIGVISGVGGEKLLSTFISQGILKTLHPVVFGALLFPELSSDKDKKVVLNAMILSLIGAGSIVQSGKWLARTKTVKKAWDATSIPRMTTPPGIIAKIGEELAVFYIVNKAYSYLTDEVRKNRGSLAETIHHYASESQIGIDHHQEVLNALGKYNRALFSEVLQYEDKLKFKISTLLLTIQQEEKRFQQLAFFLEDHLIRRKEIQPLSIAITNPKSSEMIDYTYQAERALLLNEKKPTSPEKVLTVQQMKSFVYEVLTYRPQKSRMANWIHNKYFAKDSLSPEETDFQYKLYYQKLNRDRLKNRDYYLDQIKTWINEIHLNRLNLFQNKTCSLFSTDLPVAEIDELISDNPRCVLTQLQSVIVQKRDGNNTINIDERHFLSSEVRRVQRLVDELRKYESDEDKK